MPYREQHYLEELKDSLEKSREYETVMMEKGGFIKLPVWGFELGSGLKWVVTDVEQEPHGDEVWIDMKHTDGYEIAQVHLHLPSDTILDAEVTESMGL